MYKVEQYIILVFITNMQPVHLNQAHPSKNSATEAYYPKPTGHELCMIMDMWQWRDNDDNDAVGWPTSL